MSDWSCDLGCAIFNEPRRHTTKTKFCICFKVSSSLNLIESFLHLLICSDNKWTNKNHLILPTMARLNLVMKSRTLVHLELVHYLVKELGADSATSYKNHVL